MGILYGGSSNKKDEKKASRKGGLLFREPETKEHVSQVRANMNEKRLSEQSRPNVSVQPEYLKPQASVAPGSIGAIRQFEATAPKPKTKQDFYNEEAAARAKQLKGAPAIIRKPLEALGAGVDRLQANIPGLADFQRGAGRTLGVEAQTAPLTGGKVGKYAGIAGSIAGYGVNPAAIEQNLFTGGYKVANGALGTKVGQSLLGASQRGVARAANLANPALNRIGVNIGSNLTDNIAERALTGGIANAYQNTALEATKGNTDARQLGRAALEGGVFGAAGDVAAHAAGSAIGKGLSALRERRASVSPEMDAATTKAFESVKPEPKRQLGVAYGKLTPASNEQYINKVMGDIKSVVTERMTPPLENPKELAKWLQPHLGDASLNEIRQLPYEDMRQLAEEVRSHLSTYDMARQAAKERGYDLDQLLNNQTPSIKQTADRLRMGAVAGAVEAPKGNVRMALSPEYTPSVKPTMNEATPVSSAAEQTPKNHWFTSLFGNQGVGITPGFGRGGRNKLTTEGQIVDNPLKRDIKGIKDEVTSRTRAAYQDYVDENNPLKFISRETYDTAADTRRANNIANVATQDKFVDLQGNVVGEGLKNIVRKVPRGQGNAFEDYLILRHAKTRMLRGENVYDPKLNMTPEKVQDRIDMYEKRYPQFKDIGNEWNMYYKNIREVWGVKDGRLLSADQAAILEKENPNYASMRRQFSTSEKYANPFAVKSKSFSGQKAPIKEVSPTGSIRKIVSPIRSAIEATGAWANAAMRNRVMIDLWDRINADPEAFKGIAQVVPESQDAAKKSLNEINDLLKTDGVEGLMEKLDNEFLFNKGVQKGGKTDNIVTVMLDGKPAKIQVENPEVFKSLVGMGPEESSLVMDMFAGLSNATKYSATGPLAPFFAAKGLSTDVAQALIQSKDPIRHIPDLLHATISSIANKLPKGTPGFQVLRSLAEDFQRTGGEYSAALRGDRPLNRSVRGMKREPILSGKSLVNATIATAKTPFRVLHSISDIAENVNRIAAYKGELRRLGGERTPENIRNAMIQSQEITTNFSKKGSKSKGIEKFVPYTNAAIQSVRRFARQFKTNPVRSLALVGGAVIAPKVWEYATFGDDPDYQRLPAREKYRNIIIGKNADGTFRKLPMPPEYNALGAATVDLLTAFKDGDHVNWRQSADAIVNAYTPPFISGAAQGVTQGGGPEQSIIGALNSTSIAPFVAVAGNQSFTGAPIVSQRLQSNSPGQQYDERTSDPAKWIGQKIGMAPLKVDYLIRAYGGDPSRLVLPLMSDVGAGTPRNTLLKNFIVDPVLTNTLSSDFYALKDKITQAESDNRTNTVPLPKWYNAGIADYVTSQKKGGVSKRLSELSSAKRDVNGDKSLSAQQKSDKLRDIQAQMNEIYLDAITKMKEAGIP